jgi:hypothetical protein
MDAINSNKIIMKHFSKWTEGKKPFLAATALTIAGYSKECFLLFEVIEKEKLRHKNLTTTERYIRGLEPVRPALEVLSNRNSRP